MTFAFPNALRTVVVDAFLLERAKRAALGFTPAQQRAVRARFDAAERRLAVATDVGELRHAPVAAGLQREAGILLVGALLLSRDADADVDRLDPPTAWARVDELVASGALGAPPEGYEQARAQLAEESPLAYDEKSPDELEARRASAEAALAWLRDAIEPRTIGEIRRSSWMRIGVLVVGLAALVFLIASRIVAPPNVALRKAVETSSKHPTANAPGEGAVDGKTDGAFGVHTGTNDPSPWVKVDLGNVFKVAKVKVYNRGDGWFDEGLPMVLETSLNGTDWTLAERRTEPFSQSSPWTWNGANRKTRWVRVRVDKTGYLALSEIEVYGRPSK